MDNVIESYLIALGVDIDKSDFAEADKPSTGYRLKSPRMRLNGARPVVL